MAVKDGFAGKVSEGDIDRAHQHIALYKRPRIVGLRDALPKPATGKVRWRSLQDP